MILLYEGIAFAPMGVSQLPSKAIRNFRSHSTICFVEPCEICFAMFSFMIFLTEKEIEYGQ